MIMKISSYICKGEGEVAYFSAKRWDRRNRADLIESATPFHDAQVVGLYRVSNPLRLTVLNANSEDYTTAPQHLRVKEEINFSPILKSRNTGCPKKDSCLKNHQNIRPVFKFLFWQIDHRPNYFSRHRVGWG